MAAFEFGKHSEREEQNRHNRFGNHNNNNQDERQDQDQEELRAQRIISEPVLALKIYDSCRNKKCLTASDIGEAQAHNGMAIRPPRDANSVSIDDIRVKRITILSKEPSHFRSGYWDLEIKYEFEYNLKFIGREGHIIDVQQAHNSYISHVSMFGSVGAQVTIATDLFSGDGNIMNGEPYAMVEAKVMPLAAKIKRRRPIEPVDPDYPEASNRSQVHVTLGLYSITKLYRIVALQVESRGFVIPEPCRNLMPPNPCDFFEGLDFPMDSFAPPQKREFRAGISSNIPVEATQEEVVAEIEAE
jgi:hypothetical protein